jgi:hypothetical protein
MARQTSLPDTGVFRSDILQAMNQVLSSQKDLSDRLFVLENLLEAATDEA